MHTAHLAPQGNSSTQVPSQSGWRHKPKETTSQRPQWPRRQVPLLECSARAPNTASHQRTNRP
eukprot:6799595-Alexandrium_andersonii.AAC.1